MGTPAALWLGVPLKIKNEVIGVMTTQSYTNAHHFDKTDVDVFVSVSDQVAMAIERKAYEIQLKEAHDALETRIRRRTNALEKINRRLESEIRKKELTENILRESEARLIQSERFAATGQLAASIAHEINSPLQGVTSLLNVMRREYDRDTKLEADLDQIGGRRLPFDCPACVDSSKILWKFIVHSCCQRWTSLHPQAKNRHFN